MPATTTIVMVRNLTKTKKLFRLVLALVLMELAVLMMMRMRTARSLCEMRSASPVTPAAEYALSTKTMLRMASVAGMTATTQVQAARKPAASP